MSCAVRCRILGFLVFAALTKELINSPPFAKDYMARYLITGIAGFIGSSLARGLLKRGETVRGIDNFSTGKRENLAEIANNIDFREIDLLEEAGLNDACQDVD